MVLDGLQVGGRDALGVDELPRDCLGPLPRPRHHGDVGSLPREKSGDTLADRPGATEHDGAARCGGPRRERHVAPRRHHGCGRGGVGSGRIDENAEPHRAEECRPNLRRHRLGGRHVGTSDEDGGRGEIPTAAGEHAAVHERDDVLRRHAAMPQEHVGPGIHGDDRIKRARLRIAVELDEHLLRHGSLTCRDSGLGRPEVRPQPARVHLGGTRGGPSRRGPWMAPPA